MQANNMKQIKVKYSPIFEEQLEKLKEIIEEKNSKFHNQLLVAIEREKNNLFVNPHHVYKFQKNKFLMSILLNIVLQIYKIIKLTIS